MVKTTIKPQQGYPTTPSPLRFPFGPPPAHLSARRCGRWPRTLRANTVEGDLEITFRALNGCHNDHNQWINGLV